MKKRRIFIAISISPKLKKIALKFLNDFRTDIPIKKTKEENMHITVVFCGDTPDERLKKLKQDAGRITKQVSKFQLTPKKIVFAPPHAHTPNMIWITFKHSPEFVELSKKFSSHAPKKMKKAFPHITLARFDCSNFHGLKKLIPPGGVNLENEALSFSVERINIMESAPSLNGRKYKLLKTFELV